MKDSPKRINSVGDICYVYYYGRYWQIVMTDRAYSPKKRFEGNEEENLKNR